METTELVAAAEADFPESAQGEAGSPAMEAAGCPEREPAQEFQFPVMADKARRSIPKAGSCRRLIRRWMFRQSPIQIDRSRRNSRRPS